VREGAKGTGFRDQGVEDSSEKHLSKDSRSQGVKDPLDFGF